MMKWLWAVMSALLFCSAFPASAEDVVELWRGGDFYENYSMSVNPIDSSVWAGNGNIVYQVSNVVHLAENGEVLWQGPPAGPQGLSVDARDGSVWVASEEEYEGGVGRVVHLGSDGTYLWWTGGWIPNCISADSSDGSCWVPWHHWEGTQLQNAVLHLAADGSELGRVSAAGDPLSVSVDPTDGSCWVGYRPSVGSSTTVVHWSADHQLLSEAATDLAVAGSSLPVVAASPYDGSCWVADSQGSEVLHLASDGSLLSQHLGFNLPKGLAVNPIDGSCWVADYFNFRVVHLSATGAELWHSSGVYATGFDSPYAICVNPADGSCWVGNYHGEVVHLAAMPVASFSASPSTGPVPLSVQFADRSTSATTWLWDFGDGATATEQSPTHLYEAPGSYTVSLVASSRWGADTLTQTGCILALPPAPSADFLATPTGGAAPLTVQFEDVSKGNPTSWSWTFGDGGTSTSPSPLHTYAGAGSYTVSLSASNEYGADTETKADCVLVTHTPPVADFSADVTSGYVPRTVTFTDLSTGGPTGWTWDFGDGATSSEQHPSHTYLTTGPHTVSLTVTDGADSDTLTKDGFITLAGFSDVPVGRWGFDQIGACANAGIVAGYGDGTYQPRREVTRGQMAAFISRAMCGGDDLVPTGPATATFTDVPTDSPFFRHVEFAYSQGVVKGYMDGSYQPTRAVNRGQMAAFLARAICGGEEYVPTGPTTASFADVPTGFPFFRHVECIYANGVTTGYQDGLYHPEYACLRDQMAVFVARAFALPE